MRVPKIDGIENILKIFLYISLDWNKIYILDFSWKPNESFDE